MALCVDYCTAKSIGVGQSHYNYSLLFGGLQVFVWYELKLSVVVDLFSVLVNMLKGFVLEENKMGRE